MLFVCVFLYWSVCLSVRLFKGSRRQVVSYHVFLPAGLYRAGKEASS